MHCAEAGQVGLSPRLTYRTSGTPNLCCLHWSGCKNWPGMLRGLTQGADLTGLEPSGDAVEVEGVVAHTPGDCAFLVAVGDLVSLALDA